MRSYLKATAIGFLLGLLGVVSSSFAQQLTIPFDVCVQSDEWKRPSPDVQSKVWNDPRYRDIGRNAYEWTHSFIPAEPDSASIQYSIMNLSGVWTDGETNRCQWRGADERGKWTEMWSLNYQVTGISLMGLAYIVIVAPRERGYEVIQFRRSELLGSAKATLRVVNDNGKTLAEWVEVSPSAFAPIQ
jgi:hypothetical protein